MVNKFYDLRGGTERVLFDVSAGLTERGHQVIPFAMRDDRNEPSDYAEYFVPPRDYDAPGTSRASLAVSMIHDREARRCLARLLDAHAVDVAHLHNIYHQLSPSILAELRSRSIPVVMTLHDYKLVCPVYRLFRDGATCEKCVGTRTPLWAGVHGCHVAGAAQSWVVALESTWHRWTRAYERGVDVFVSPSRFLADVVRRHGVGDVRVIPNAPRERAAAASIEARAATPRVLFAGRLSFEKGVDVLIRAAREVPDVEVVVAGTGPEQDTLQAMAADCDHVRFVGRLDAASLREERSKAWAEVLPSVWYENAPLSLLESYAMGRPVIAAAHGGLLEMVESDETGWLVPPGDDAAWQAALRRVAAEPDALATMGDAARRRLDRDYRFEDCVTSYEALYEETMGLSVSQ